MAFIESMTGWSQALYSGFFGGFLILRPKKLYTKKIIIVFYWLHAKRLKRRAKGFP